ncbi:MAG: ankyrin repeat domain-containing protein [Tepidisphaeraceae bacterium]
MHGIIQANPAIVNELHTPGDSRLGHAAWQGHANTVKLMLDLGFDPTSVGPDSGTPLHCAAWQGNAEIVELILSHPKVKPRLAELIDRKEATHNSTPLGWCCHGSTMNRGDGNKNYARVAELLLDAGASSAAHNEPNASSQVRAVLQRRNAMSKDRVRREGGRVWIEGVPPLAWGKSGETTFCGALAAAYKAMNVARDYVDLMGDTGLAFHVRWWRNEEGPGWCPSSMVGEMQPWYPRAYASAGFAFRDYVHLDGKTDMGRYAGEVVASIEAGRPALVYGNNMDCAVIFGFEDGGQTVLIRDYYRGNEVLTMPLSQTKGLLSFIEPGPVAPDAAARREPRFDLRSRTGRCRWCRCTVCRATGLTATATMRMRSGSTTCVRTISSTLRFRRKCSNRIGGRSICWAMPGGPRRSTWNV